MIFRQVAEIIDGIKTQTRRIAKDNELFRIDGYRGNGVFVNGKVTLRAKWIMGRRYAVTPKMYQPTFVMQSGRKLYIVVTRITKEPLQNITEADAHAEGVASIADYKLLWDSINTKHGTRWSDNPDVWVIEFKPQV